MLALHKQLKRVTQEERETPKKKKKNCKYLCNVRACIDCDKKSYLSLVSISV